MTPPTKVIMALASKLEINFDDEAQAARLGSSGPKENLVRQSLADRQKQAEFIQALAERMQPMIHGLLTYLTARLNFAQKLSFEAMKDESIFYGLQIAHHLWGLGECKCVESMERMGVVTHYKRQQVTNIWQERHEQWHRLAAWDPETVDFDNFLAMALTNQPNFTRATVTPSKNEKHVYNETVKFFFNRARSKRQRGVAESMLAYLVQDPDSGLKLQRRPILECNICKGMVEENNRCHCPKGPITPFEKDGKLIGGTTVNTRFLRDEPRESRAVYRCHTCKFLVFPVLQSLLQCGICNNNLGGRGSTVFVVSGELPSESLGKSVAIDIHAATNDTRVQRPNYTLTDMDLAERVVARFPEFRQRVNSHPYLSKHGQNQESLNDFLKIIFERYNTIANPRNGEANAFNLTEGLNFPLHGDSRMFRIMKEELASWLREVANEE